MLELKHLGEVVRLVPENTTIQYGDGLWLSPTYAGWSDGAWSLSQYVAPAEVPDFPLLPLSRVQFRKLLKYNGYSIADITEAIDAMPESTLKDEFSLYWNDSFEYEADNPLTIAAAESLLDMTKEEMEHKWRVHLYGEDYDPV